MPAVMEELFTSLNELEQSMDSVSDPLEKEGLKSFINCITPQLMDEASVSLLGKIAQVTGLDSLDTIQGLSKEELISKIGEEFEITVE